MGFAPAPWLVHRPRVLRRQRPWLHALALASLALLTLFALVQRVGAQPTLLVRADTRIELRVDRRVDGSIHLIGTLRDDLGATLVGIPIDVSAWNEGPGADRERWTAHPRTDATGSFDVIFQPEDGWWASASFAGDELYLATEARQRLDLRLEHVSLTVHVEGAGVLDLDQPEHTVRVETTSAVGGADLSISLRNEMGVPLGEGRTDLSGAVTLTVPSSALGPPSAGRLIALSAADALRSAAQAEVPIVRLRPTQLTLATTARDEARVMVAGTLTDSSGPRAREAVGLYAGDRHMGTAATDETGRYALEVPLDALAGLGAEVSIVARYSSDAPWIGPSESTPITVSFRPAFFDTTAVVGMGSLALLLLVLGLLLGGRRRDVAAEATPELGRSAMVLGQRGRARITTLSGRLEDVRTHQAIRGAEVRLGAAMVKTDAEGSFAFEGEGSGRLEIQASGYESFTATVSVPHRGEHAGMRIGLVSFRDLALAPLRPIALRLLPSSELWSLWTQRELLSALRKAGREPPELASLIDRVESACYGHAPPDAEQIAAIRDQAARIESSFPAASPRA